VDPKTTVKRWVEAINQHDPDAVASCFDPDYHDEAPARRGESVVGRQKVRQNFVTLFKDIPDIRAELIGCIAEGDEKVWIEWRMGGTRKDGTKMEFAGVNIFGVKDGRLARGRIYSELVREAGDIDAQIGRMAGGSSEEQSEASIIANTSEAKTVSLGPNRVAFLLRGEQTKGHYSLSEFTLAPPPAPGAPMHVHKAEDELTYVLEGEVEFMLEERSERASVGSFFLVPKGTPHTLSNAGAGAARILVVLTPPGFEGYWEEASQLLERSGGDPDPAQMRALQEKHNMDAGGQARRFSPEA